ncbi:MAG: ATP-dependent helicase [Bacteroidales bacterium]|nr:UvrD-helicase domain-containing protein [Bacteroidales bacterium]
MNTLFEGLNEAQQKAVAHYKGAMMVIAGAGSGKTRVLTHRIAYMISQGVNPFEILSLTFTNKAAAEMKERVMELLSNNIGRNVWMGTFHSIFSRILHIESEYLGFSKNFTVYDQDDSKNLIKTIIKEKNLDDKQYRPSTVQAMISNAKSNLLSPEEYNSNSLIYSENQSKRMEMVGSIYSAYNQRLKRLDAMDFDDLLFNMYVLLRDFPDMLYKYQHKFKYILVDEYQDTNYVQYQIVKKLAALHENICVVGDDAQSIYAFRGANIQNIINFKEDYPDYSLFKLEQNYRSTQTILNAANAVIKNNKEQIHKTIWTANEEGSKIKLIECLSESDEAQKVAGSIVDFKQKNNLTYKDFTILYRTNAQSRPLEEVFVRMGIPYRIYGGKSFYQRKEIKDVLAYCRLTVNYKDDESLRRIINYPQRGIGTTTMEKVMAAANDNNCSIWEIISQPEKYDNILNQGTWNKLTDFVAKIKSFHFLLDKQDAFELGKYIADKSGITEELKMLTEEKERYENLGELFNAMKNFTERTPENTIDMETGEDLSNYFPSLNRFLEEVVLLTDADEEDKTGNNKVKLMTIHASKGLEFPYVYIVGLEENLFPSHMVSSQSEMEEERRLFYVAITRTKQHLTLSYARSRFVFGSINYAVPSSFLKEIDKNLIESPHTSFNQPTLIYKNVPKYTSPTQVKKNIPFSKKDAQEVSQIKSSVALGAEVEHLKQLKIGMTVFHDKFGLGKIEEMIEDGANSKTIITFEKFGKKTMLLRFAKLKIVNQ